MKTCYSVLLVLGIFIMGLGQLQYMGEVARWSQLYAILDGENGKYDALIVPEVTNQLHRAYLEDAQVYNGTSMSGFFVFIVSGIGLMLSFRSKKATSRL